MKLSTKGRYGLRAMVDIAVYSQDSPVPISAIAERQNISVRYLEQLLPKLKKAGIIKSIRGAQGGYMLDKDPKDISAGDILRTLEGDLTPIDCAAFTGDTSTCSGTKFCVTKTVWQRINDSVQQAVDSITLQELMEDPFPRWQTITLELSLSRPRNSTARLDTKLWEVPWKPYLLTL